jgi:hypothetical protein
VINRQLPPDRTDRRAGQNVVGGTRAAIYTYLATVYSYIGHYGAPHQVYQARPGFCTAPGEHCWRMLGAGEFRAPALFSPLLYQEEPKKAGPSV